MFGLDQLGLAEAESHHPSHQPSGGHHGVGTGRVEPMISHVLHPITFFFLECFVKGSRVHCLGLGPGNK